MGFTFTFPFWGKHCSLRFQCPDNIRKLHIANMQFCKSFLQKIAIKKRAALMQPVLRMSATRCTKSL